MFLQEVLLQDVPANTELLVQKIEVRERSKDSAGSTSFFGKIWSFAGHLPSSQRTEARSPLLQPDACALFRAMHGPGFPHRRQLHHPPSNPFHLNHIISHPGPPALAALPGSTRWESWGWQGPWVMIERECFARSMPASKKASAGPIMREKAVATMIHVVSPVLMLHSICPATAIFNLSAKAGRKDGRSEGRAATVGEQDPCHQIASTKLTES